MADMYEVTAEVAIIQLPAGGESYKYRGSLIPADGLTAESAEHLLGQKLIREVGEQPAVEPVEPVEGEQPAARRRTGK